METTDINLISAQCDISYTVVTIGVFLESVAHHKNILLANKPLFIKVAATSTKKAGVMPAQICKNNTDNSIPNRLPKFRSPASTGSFLARWTK